MLPRFLLSPCIALLVYDRKNVSKVSGVRSHSRWCCWSSLIHLSIETSTPYNTERERKKTAHETHSLEWCIWRWSDICHIDYYSGDPMMKNVIKTCSQLSEMSRNAINMCLGWHILHISPPVGMQVYNGQCLTPRLGQSDHSQIPKLRRRVNVFSNGSD